MTEIMCDIVNSCGSIDIYSTFVMCYLPLLCLIFLPFSDWGARPFWFILEFEHLTPANNVELRQKCKYISVLPG